MFCTQKENHVQDAEKLKNVAMIDILIYVVWFIDKMIGSLYLIDIFIVHNFENIMDKKLRNVTSKKVGM